MKQLYIDTLARYAELVKEHKPRLTELDEISGDGDFGNNLDGGLQRAIAEHETNAPTMADVANVFLDEVGGTSGPLFGLFFAKLDEHASASEGLTDADTDTLASIRAGVSEGTRVIMDIGEAEVGDRTIVDTLYPATEALGDITEMQAFTTVSEAAVKGAEDTAKSLARRGRGSYVGDRVLGNPDPGAVGIALFFVALNDVLFGETVQAETASYLNRLLLTSPVFSSQAFKKRAESA